MPEYLVAAACLVILTLTGALKAPFAALGLSGARVSYIVCAALALSIFQLEYSVELSVNAGAAAMLLLPPLLMKRQQRGGGGVLAAVTMFSLLTALLGRSELFKGVDSGVMSALFAASSAMLLSSCPADAVFAASAIPVASQIAASFLMLMDIGYAGIFIGREVIAAQMIALAASAAIVWLHGLLLSGAGAER